MTAIIVAAWAVSGFLAYGACVGDFYRTFGDTLGRRSVNYSLAWTVAVMGPLGLFVALMACGFRRGFLWRVPR